MARFFTYLGLLVALLRAAPAATISTIDSIHAGYTDVTWNQWAGQAFVVTTQSTVVSATVPVWIVAPNVNFVVRVVGSTISNPNAPDLANVRATLRSPSAFTASAGVQIIQFLLEPSPTPQLLEPNTRYWLVMGQTDPDFNEANSAGMVKWSYTNTLAPTAQPTDPGAILNFTGESGSAGTGWSVLGQSPQRLGMEVTPIPEPGVVGCVGLGLVLCLQWGRRRNFNFLNCGNYPSQR